MIIVLTVSLGIAVAARLRSLDRAHDIIRSSGLVIKTEERSAFETLLSEVLPSYKVASVTDVTFGSQPVTDELLVDLRACRQIRALRLSNTNVCTPDLSAFQQLEVLAVDHTAVGDDGVMAMGALPRLRELYLAHTSISDKAMTIIGTMRYLECLDVSDTKVTTHGVSCLLALRSLKRLTMNGIAIDNSVGDVVAQIRSLQYLAVDRNNLGEEFCCKLQSMHQLEVLSIAHDGGDSAVAYGDGNGIQCLGKLHRLEDLDASGLNIPSGSFAKGTFLSLRSLAINGAEIDDEVFAEIVRLPGVVRLSMDDTGVSSAAFRLIPCMQQLKELYLAGCPNIDRRLVSPLLKQMPRLRFVSWTR